MSGCPDSGHAKHELELLLLDVDIEGARTLEKVEERASNRLKVWGHVAVGQNQWYHFGVGAQSILVNFSGWIGMFTGGTGF